MISVTSAQLEAWLAAFIFPMARILAMLAAAPVFNNAGLPRQIRVVFGIAISLALVPALPATETISPGSWLGIAVLGQQILIGVIFGLTLRLMFTAVDMAGEIIGLQMGLSFASFFDPSNSAQTSAIGSFLGLLMTLMFLAMNGHLLMLSALAESFQLLPVSTTVFAAKGFSALLAWSTVIFTTSLMLALPLITALLIANISLGVLARIAPQLNIFAVGFPVTIVTGYTVLLFSLPHFGAVLQSLYEQGFAALSAVLQAGGALPAAVP
ncbi:MAG: flagellar biosynthetic protein FliR [Sterolibacterium sp.]|nr:flagellar biosynthetic protein FliR [Sterolibacterium sp.]